MKLKKPVLVLLVLLSFLPTSAQNESSSDEKNDTSPQNIFDVISNDVTISGQWFFGYQKKRINQVEENEFLLKRGYLTVEKQFSQSVRGRITQDVSVDQEGDGEGDVELRLKYGYVRFYFDDFALFHSSFVEFGLVHRPWIDFEQKINRYRVQGPMFLDRNNILSSADYGFTFTTLFGGEVAEEYQKTVSSSYPGKYGSATFGIYNGGGYHAIEENENKIFEGRISLRPLPFYAPGIQLSYVNLFGKGNVVESPDFNLNAFSISYESIYLNFLGTIISGKGDQSGKLINEFEESYSTSGYTLFSEIKLPGIPFALIGRYDFLEYANFERKNYIAGAAYKFLGDNKILIDYDLMQTNENNFEDNYTWEFAVELKF